MHINRKVNCVIINVIVIYRFTLNYCLVLAFVSFRLYVFHSCIYNTISFFRLKVSISYRFRLEPLLVRDVSLKVFSEIYIGLYDIFFIRLCMYLVMGFKLS